MPASFVADSFVPFAAAPGRSWHGPVLPPRRSLRRSATKNTKITKSQNTKEKRILCVLCALRGKFFFLFCAEAVERAVGVAEEDAASDDGGGGGGKDWDFPPVIEQWRSLVAAYFPASRVDEALAILQCESLGDPDAYNPYSGASGLFQFLPSTWASTSPKAGFAGAGAFAALHEAELAMTWLEAEVGQTLNRRPAAFAEILTLSLPAATFEGDVHVAFALMLALLAATGAARCRRH